MKLTPEQRQQVDAAKARGENRIVFTDLTPEQVAAQRLAIAEAEADRPRIVALFKKMAAAAKEAGFSGSLRRAIYESNMMPQDLALEAGIDPLALEAFACGEAPLPTDAVDLLVEHLGLALVKEPV